MIVLIEYSFFRSDPRDRMLSVFASFKSLFQLKKCLIDNTTFRMHYQWTFAILCVCSLLQTLTQFFGKPIDCMVEGVSKSVFDTYCWIHGTFTLPSQLTGRRGVDFPHPGVGPYPHSSTNTEDSNLVEVTADGDEIRHAWYQWVIFVLFLQALCCYLPHYLWKVWEGKKISLLVQDLDCPTLDTVKEKTEEKRRVIVNYFYKNNRTHNLYVSKFVFCEFLNLVNILGQMYLMDLFFSGSFLDYGFNIMSSTSGDNLEKEIAQVFPKIGKCTINTYGVSGTIQTDDSFCVLPLNNFNGKFYFFLWFWYLLVLSWTSIFFCFRIITIASR